MYISAYEAAKRLDEVAQQFMISIFKERSSYRKIFVRMPPLRIAYEYAYPIMDLIDIMSYSDFPNDEKFYKKLFSFTDPVVLLGLETVVEHSVKYLKEEGLQLYDVPEDDYTFFREYAIIGFL